MATNFDRYKQLLEKRAESDTKSKATSKWLKIEKGATKTVRFLPLKSQNLELPLEIWDHHAITFPDGKYESFTCCKKKDGTSCPFCEMASKAWKTYASTKDEAYKQAFKNLIVKSAYLLVGYDVDKVDPSNITDENTFIVRASSEDARASIDNFLAKGKDFVDFSTGRSCALKKPMADKQAISWTWDDPEPAFTSKNGQAVWNQILAVSPDLTEMVASPSPERLAELVDRFNSGVAEPDDDVPSIPSRSEAPKQSAITSNRTPTPVDATSMPEANEDYLNEIRDMLKSN